MTAEIVELDVVTTLDLPAERVIRKAAEENLETVIIVGIREDGEFFFAANKADGADSLWWLEVAKKKLLEAGT